MPEWKKIRPPQYLLTLGLFSVSCFRTYGIAIMLSAVLQITYQLTLSLMRENIRFALSLDGPEAPAQEEVSAAIYNAQDLDGHERSESYLRSHSSIKVREVKNHLFAWRYQ